MKRLMTISCILFSVKSFAMSDVERAILYGANAASMGTYVAQMEGEIERIKLNAEKQIAEFKLKMEKDHQAYLKIILTEEFAATTAELEQYTIMQRGLSSRNATFNQIITIASDLYKGMLKKEFLVNELHRLNETFPAAEQEWIELMKQALGSNDIDGLTADQFEALLMESMRIYSDSRALELQINEQISYLQEKLLNIKDRLKDML